MAAHDAEALRLFEEGLTYEQIRERLGLRTTKQVNHALWRARKAQKIEYVDRIPPPSPETIDELYHALINLGDAIKKADTKQTKTTIRINDHRPIGICFWGDWHIYCRGWDYYRFEADKQAIMDTDGLFYIGTGDYKEGQLPSVHASGTFEQLAQPGIQDLIVQRIIEQTGESCLALVRGCHDDWTKKVADQDFISRLSEIANCVNLWHGGLVTIQLGDQEYQIRARHKYKNESGLNTTNVHRNIMNDFGPCDVIAVAHKHFPDYQQLKRMGDDVLYMRSGAYKPYDEHGQKLAGYEGTWGVPVVILYPDRHHKIGFKDLYDGILHLKAARDQYEAVKP